MTEATGYQKLAGFMANEQYEIFRKFRSSACRDLLYFQAELAELEEELAALADRDRKFHGEQELYDGNWHLLSTSKIRDCGGDQWEKALQIREKLKEYYDCVSRYSAITNIPQARRRDVSMLKEWISRPDLGGGLLFSGGDLNPPGRPVYQNEHSDDLMTLSRRAGENDPFTRLLSGPVFHGFDRLWRLFKSPTQSDPEKGTSNLLHYADSHVLGVIDVLGTILASMTPLVSIIALYFVQSLGFRLAIVCSFTLLFSVSLALVTRARRIEVFACTAA
ncbi:hypothetical protein LSUE1_G009182 [Lachnellula suecica]|uniref:DUF6594 domain-containing protein n=1 Tax=Lachnellula suecica TaxID=602035 RepID=A0A8T9BUE5_9HELO|nr:hypothetical protein LSUE1_G009182 [Lachnellula suecica]